MDVYIFYRITDDTMYAGDSDMYSISVKLNIVAVFMALFPAGKGKRE
jgi:hypothetical protein